MGIAEARGREGVGNPRGLTPRRPGPGSARGRGSLRQGRARGRPSLPGAGRLTFVLVFNVFCPLVLTLARRHNCHALSSRAAALQVQGARSAAAAASVCTGGNAAIARSALCGVCDSCKVRECVYQPRIDAPGGRHSHGRRPARGVDPHPDPGSGLTRPLHVSRYYDIHCESPGVPDPPPRRPRASPMPTYKAAQPQSSSGGGAFSSLYFTRKTKIFSIKYTN